jgi:hypothetical protein
MSGHSENPVSHVKILGNSLLTKITSTRKVCILLINLGPQVLGFSGPKETAADGMQASVLS